MLSGKLTALFPLNQTGRPKNCWWGFNIITKSGLKKKGGIWLEVLWGFFRADCHMGIWPLY